MNPNHWLVREREKRNMTQSRVAQLAGIERSYYTKIENGTIPSVKVAKRIARVFEIDWTIFYAAQPEDEK